MTWSDNDAVQFDAHLSATLGAVRTAMADLGFASLVIAAGDEQFFFQDDQTTAFRPNPWFRWLVPTSPAPGSLLQISPERPPRLLFVAADDYWHSPPVVPDAAWTQSFHVEALPDPARALEAVRSAAGPVAWIGPAPPPDAAWQHNPPRLLARLEQARCSKTAYELACLRTATRIAVAGHQAAERAFRDGAAEFDIHLAYLAAVRQTEAELPYPDIVALNEHAATLHYQRRDTGPPRRSLSLLIDAGASCLGYGSDITRTWAMLPGPFASLVDGMHSLQQELCNAVAPGVDWRALHLQAHMLVARLLQDAGILAMDPAAAVDSGVSACFLPHGLGHLLGLKVHDVGGFRPAAEAEQLPAPPGHPALRLTRPLVAGMVVTVEPGLYFIDSLLAGLRAGPHAPAVNWRLVDALRPCGGIRIEDNVVVTADGHENLTRAAFAGVA